MRSAFIPIGELDDLRGSRRSPVGYFHPRNVHGIGDTTWIRDRVPCRSGFHPVDRIWRTSTSTCKIADVSQRLRKHNLHLERHD